MRRALIIVAAVVVLAVIAAGGWFLFLRDDEDELTLADNPARPAVTPAGGLSGTWTVGPGSVAGYRVNEKLASLPSNSDAVGRTEGVKGSVQITQDGSTIGAADGNFEVDVTQLESDQSRRDNAIKDRGLQTNQFPTATFKTTAPINVPAEATNGQQVKANAVGDLTIHGQTRNVTIPLDVRLNGPNIELAGAITFPFSQFGMEPPSNAIASVGDTATMELKLVLTKTG